MAKKTQIQKLIDQAGGAPEFIRVTGVPERTVYRWQAGTSAPHDWLVPMIAHWLNSEDAE